MKEKSDCEVAVVGGGMVGAALACSLARGGIQVALLESRAPERTWPADTADLRVSALTYASKKMLETIGAWSGMEQHGVSPYRFMRVWDADYRGELFFDGADVGEDILGHIIENRVTVAALWELLETLPSTEVLCPAQVVDLQRSELEATLILEDGSRLRADLIVAADGKASRLRELAGIDVTGWSYGQSALVATVQPDRWHEETAYQRFLSEGPLAFLPLRDGACSIVWSCSHETTKKHLAMDDETFLHALTEASGSILGTMKRVGLRAAFPLGLQFALKYTDDRVALVGDAAHAMHPLAGQGANMGLLDAAALAEVICQARRHDRPIFSRHALRRYERWRKGDNFAMLASMDALKRMYGVSFAPWGHLRSTGMRCIDRTPPLKNFLTRYAMGIRGDLPKLAYGVRCWQS